MAELLTRDEFRESVFRRDGHKCVICSAAAKDAHHIIERRLWPDGGYYLDNGASLCEEHHIEAEKTTLSCEKIREAAHITKVLLAAHLYDDQAYDKWGNPILPNGTRLRGDLFFDESVQKILGLGGVLGLFSNRVKYPRTYHLPWSPGVGKDDRQHEDDALFQNEMVVVTLKMDGENTTMYRDYIHARSLDFDSQPDRDWVKGMVWGRINYEIPQDWRLCGENLWAKHAIKYTDLPSYFMLFSIWNERNECVSWSETVEWAKLLEVEMVPVLYYDLYDRERIEKAFLPFKSTNEGYVIRRAGRFPYSAFRNSVGKYVRAGHVPEHGRQWRRHIEKNELATNAR